MDMLERHGGRATIHNGGADALFRVPDGHALQLAKPALDNGHGIKRADGVTKSPPAKSLRQSANHEAGDAFLPSSERTRWPGDSQKIPLASRHVVSPGAGQI